MRNPKPDGGIIWVCLGRIGLTPFYAVDTMLTVMRLKIPSKQTCCTGWGTVRRTTAGLLFAVVLLAGCLATAGPRPEILTYSLPTTLTVDRGQALSCSDILYESAGDEGVYLVIDGQRALKRRGDSVKWSGSPELGADVSMDMRIVWYTEEQIHLVGMAHITVHNAAPRAGVAESVSGVSFSGPVAYGVTVDSYVPGTPLAYVGPSENGAELGGLYNEYPYRQIGDSILWEGRLRSQVYIRLELRTVHFDERGLRVAGFATIWFGS